MTQGCNNIVISWLYRACWNNFVTSLIISTRLLQIVNILFQICWQLVLLTTACWQTLLLKTCVFTRKNAQVVTTCSNAVLTTCQQDVLALLVPSLLTSCQRFVGGNLLQGCWAQQTCCKLFQQLIIVLQFHNVSTSCEWQPCSNLIKWQHCYNLLNKLSTSLLRTHLVEMLWDFYVCIICRVAQFI